MGRAFRNAASNCCRGGRGKPLRTAEADLRGARRPLPRAPHGARRCFRSRRGRRANDLRRRRPVDCLAPPARPPPPTATRSYAARRASASILLLRELNSLLLDRKLVRHRRDRLAAACTVGIARHPAEVGEVLVENLAVVLDFGWVDDRVRKVDRRRDRLVDESPPPAPTPA